MNGLTFTIIEKPTGWFVIGSSPIGPFMSKDHAIDLAEGMASSLRLMGQTADVRISARESPHPEGDWRPIGPCPEEDPATLAASGSPKALIAARRA